MKKYIITGFVVAAVLAIAFLFGGKADAPKTYEPPVTADTAETAEPTAAATASVEEKKEEIDSEVSEKNNQTPTPKTEPTPVPNETERTEPAAEEKMQCTISVSCRSILSGNAKISPEKAELIPKDGFILPETTVIFSEGESVFDVTLRVMREHNIHYEFSKTPVYKSAYTEGIGNIYELDCGELSGWMYRVNGVFPGVGCSRCVLKNGDNIEWLYTCDLGRDIGGYFESGGGQRDE